MPHQASPKRLDPARCGLLAVDLQEKLLSAIPSGNEVVRQCHRILDAAEALDVPVAATVQYPRGLGPVESSLAPRLRVAEEKMEFSAAGCRESLETWTAADRDQVVVVGIETHVCVEQTVLDLIAEGKQVFVVAQAVAARHGQDHEWALQRMQRAGAWVTTTEAVLFGWCRTADRPEFKTISRLIKEG